MKESILTIGCSGDIGLQNEFFDFNIKNINLHSLEYFLILGDNFYPNGISSLKDSRWKELFSSLHSSSLQSIYAILGNHDYLGNPLTQIQYTKYQSKWKMPHFYYDIPIISHSVHLIFIDTILLDEKTSKNLIQGNSYEQYRKLRQNYFEDQKRWIEYTLSKSQLKWKIICGHYPILSNGPHSFSIELRDFLIPLMKKYKVQLYLSGHNHNFQHSTYESLHHVTSGCFCYQSPFFQPPQFHNIYQNNEYGWTKLSISISMITIEFITIHNKVIYSYSIYY